MIGDTVAATYHSQESSSGMQASLCVPPFCYGSYGSYGTTVHANASLTQGNTDSTYSSVQEQSGIYAGKGGFDVDVKGHTDLKGGILTSTANASKNSLTTGTLTTSDIENKAEYSSDSATIVASYSGGKSVEDALDQDGNLIEKHVQWAGNTNLLQSGANSLAATAAGNAQKSIDGSAAGVTKSAIAPGTVIVTDNAGQLAKTGKSADEIVAGLDRDTANANQSIDKIFDAQKVKDQRELNQLQSQVAQQLAKQLSKAPGSLIGPPEAPPRNASAEQVRSIARQNEAAATLADHGLNVENLPNTGKPGLNPDIKINGEVADIYSPRTGNLWSIRDTVAGKVDKQARNVVINLSDSPLSPSKIAHHLQKNPVPDMNSLFIIKNGSVTILGK